MLEFARTPKRHGAQKAEIADWKGVGFRERSHGHVLCRPFPDAGNFTQSMQERIGVHHPLKADPPIANRAGESSDGLGSRPGQANAGKPRIGKNLRLREKMSEALGRRERFPEPAYHPAGQGGRSLDGDLLAEDGTRCEFETIPAAGNSQPGISLNRPQ